jgi:hypothetical protein
MVVGTVLVQVVVHPPILSAGEEGAIAAKARTDFFEAILCLSVCYSGCSSILAMDDSSKLTTARMTTTMTTTLTTTTTTRMMTAMTTTTTTTMMRLPQTIPPTATATTKTTTTMSVSVVVTPVRTVATVPLKRRKETATVFSLRPLCLLCFRLHFPPPNQNP